MINMQLTKVGRAHRNGRTIASSFAAAMMLAATIPLASNAEAASEGKLKSMSLELATGIFAGVTVVSKMARVGLASRTPMSRLAARSRST